MSKTKTADYKKQPKSMHFLDHADKAGKGLIIESTKVWDDDKRTDRVLVPTSVLAACKKVVKNGVKEFRALLRDFARPNALAIDSASMKLNIANHDRTRIGLYNRVARFIEREDLVVEYTPAQKEQAKEAAKSKAKAVKK